MEFWVEDGKVVGGFNLFFQLTLLLSEVLLLREQLECTATPLKIGIALAVRWASQKKLEPITPSTTSWPEPSLT